MSSIHKIILAFVIVQVALVLGEESCSVAPADRKNCGWGGITKQQCESKGCCFDDSIRGVIWCFKTADCGGGCEPEGCYSRRCRSFCKSGESHVSMFDNKCTGGDKCCMCHVRWGSGCAYDN